MTRIRCISVNVRLSAKKPRSSAYPATLTTLGDKLKATRLDRNLTQKECAHVLGVTRSAIASWEKHMAVPRVSQFSALNAFLGTPSGYSDQDSLAERVKAVRTHQGCTQTQFARLLGTNPMTLRKVERGHPCHARIAARIEDYLQRTMTSSPHP